MSDLPAPRLQFRWECVQAGEWLCHYELVLRVGISDIRNPLVHVKPGEIVLPIGETRVGTQRGPVYPDGSIHVPFRDGAHAQWDRKQLGELPIYAIYNERAMEVKAVSMESGT